MTILSMRPAETVNSEISTSKFYKLMSLQIQFDSDCHRSRTTEAGIRENATNWPARETGKSR